MPESPILAVGVAVALLSHATASLGSSPPPAAPSNVRAKITVGPSGIAVDGASVMALQCRLRDRPCRAGEESERDATFLTAPKDKPGGEAGELLLAPLRDALVRVVNQHKAQSLRTGEQALLVAEILADSRIPYGTIAEVIYTAGHAGIGHYDLAVSGSPKRVEPVIPTPERPRKLDGPAAEPLTLVVTILHTGFRLRWQRGGDAFDQELPARLADPKQCAEGAAQDRVFLSGGVCRTFDRAGLYNALVLLKKRYPLERRITITAAADIRWKVLVDTIDGSRCLRAQDAYRTTESFDAAPERAAGGSGRCLELFPAVVFALQ